MDGKINFIISVLMVCNLSNFGKAQVSGYDLCTVQY